METLINHLFSLPQIHFQLSHSNRFRTTAQFDITRPAEVLVNDFSGLGLKKALFDRE